MASVLDALQRPLRNLRVSVTDRCNLRCTYCMPEEDYAWLPKARILTYEEMGSLVKAFLKVGVERVRLTGGEPLLRRDLDQLVAQLAALEGLREVTLTTNGLALGEAAGPLAEAGLSRVTVSLDTLKEARFRELCRRDGLPAVLSGIAAARSHGLPVKINTVVMRGVNDDELLDLLDYANESGAELRFIEYMDVGGATNWDRTRVLTRRQILARIEGAWGQINAEPRNDSAPADLYRAGNGTRFGIIASTTRPFCGSCDRARITADGKLYTCLYQREGVDLATALRAGETSGQLAKRLAGIWSVRSDQGAAERLALSERGAMASRTELEQDPHLEMHTRGG